MLIQQWSNQRKLRARNPFFCRCCRSLPRTGLVVSLLSGVQHDANVRRRAYLMNPKTSEKRLLDELLEPSPWVPRRWALAMRCMLQRFAAVAVALGPGTFYCQRSERRQGWQE